MKQNRHCYICEKKRLCRIKYLAWDRECDLNCEACMKSNTPVVGHYVCDECWNIVHEC